MSKKRVYLSILVLITAFSSATYGITFKDFILGKSIDVYSDCEIKNSEVEKYYSQLVATGYYLPSKNPCEINTENAAEQLEMIYDSTGDPYTRYIPNGVNPTWLKYINIGANSLLIDEQARGGVIKSSTATFISKDNDWYVETLKFNSYLELSGLKEGAKILKINNINLAILPQNDQIELLSQIEFLEVEAQQEGKIIKIPAKRYNNFQSDSLESKVIDNVGVIQIYQFEENVSTLFKETLDSYREQNITKLIIDLRNNPGGSVREALTIIELLGKNQTAMHLVDRKGEIEEIKVNPTKDNENSTIAVLVNANTASASEIVTSYFKQQDNVTIYGQKTYGKGSQFQVIATPNAKLTITDRLILGANKSVINDVGIEPTKIVNTDIALQTALEDLKKEKNA